ncbi:MAG: hypothetical protein IPG67_12590 [Acidobacteria bacterium]|nr:hypothetical protein [Acidobacteriota bacterium]
MKTRSAKFLSAASFIALFTVITTLGQGGSEYLITSESVGAVRLGMTINEAKRALDDAELNMQGENGEVKVFRKGKLVMIATVVTTDANEITGGSKIFAVKAIDSRYRTANGLYPGITIVAAEKVMGKLGRMTLSYGETETGDFANQPDGFNFEFKGANSAKAGIYDVKTPDPREQYANKFTPGAYIYGIGLSLYSDEDANTQDFTAGLAGTGWTYSYGGTTYQFDFGQTRIEKFSNGWWQGITWTSIGNNQIRLKNLESGKEMTLTFDSANSYSGIDWDGQTKVSGTRRNVASSSPANYLITKTSAGGIRLTMTIAEARTAMKGTTFERTSDGEGVALISVKQGDVQLMTLYADEEDPQRPIDETARIMNIEVWDSRFKTPNGVHVNMKLVDVEKILGKVTKIITSEIEAREYADFTKKADGFMFRLMGPDSNAGIYAEGTRETTRYVANAYIYTISIAQERSPDAVE